MIAIGKAMAIQSAKMQTSVKKGIPLPAGFAGLSILAVKPGESQRPGCV